MGSRALSHDSIFIPETGQEPARPVRVFSQENISDRIRALQVMYTTEFFQMQEVELAFQAWFLGVIFVVQHLISK